VKDAIAAMHLSVVDFLLKPIDSGELLALVKHELGMELKVRPVSAAVPTGNRICKRKSPDRKIRAFSCPAQTLSYSPLRALNSRRRRCSTGSV
jgi:DNA-binding NtrC family response regulator